MGVQVPSPKEDEEDRELEVARLGAGHSFGELSLIYNYNRTASIKATTDSHFAVLEKEVYHELLE